jgi:hypothetical protein
MKMSVLMKGKERRREGGNVLMEEGKNVAELCGRLGLAYEPVGFFILLFDEVNNFLILS